MKLPNSQTSEIDREQCPPSCRPGIRRARVNSLVLTFAALWALGWLAAPAQAITRFWTHNNSQLWSDPNNWSPVGIPQPGDDLVFHDQVTVSGPGPMTNDLAGVSVRSMDFWITSNNPLVLPDWVLNGNPITMTGPIADDALSDSERIYINCGLIIGTDLHVLINETAAASYNNEIYLTGPINLNGHTLQLINLESGVIDVSGVISGNGNVTAIGAVPDKDTVVFSGTQANTFTGILTATFGNFAGLIPKFGRIGLQKQSGAAVPGRLRVEKGAVLNINRPEQIADNGIVEVLGTGSDYFDLQLSSGIHLNGNEETIATLYLVNYAGETNSAFLDTGGAKLVVSGSVHSSSDTEQATPFISGRLELPTTCILDVQGTAYAGLDMQAQLVGSGGFLKTGGSALVLEASNSFSGSISINSGILDVRNDHALGDVAGDTSLSGGSLILRNVAIGTERLAAQSRGIGGEMPGALLTSIGSNSWAGQVLLDTNLVVVGGDMSFTGDMVGTGGIGFFNLGTSVLGGNLGNTYTGTTLVRCPLLEFNKPSGVNAYSGPLVVGGGAGGPYEARWLNSYQNVGATATLYDNGLINLDNNNEDFGPVTFNGGTVDSGSAGHFVIYAPLTVNPAPASATINGNLGLAAGADRVFIVGDGAADCDLVVNAVIYGSPGAYFVKQGAGTMCLTGINTFNTVTLLEQGILDINNGSGLGLWAGLVIFDGATLRISGPGNTIGGFEVVGAGVAGTHGAVEVLPGNSFGLSGDVLLDAASTFNIGTSGALNLSGSIVGTGPLNKTGAGLLLMSGGAHNTYSGATVVNNGSLLLAKSANKICVPGNLIIGPGPAGPLTFARLIYSGEMGGATVTVNGNSLFDLNGNNAILTGLTLNDGGQVWTGSGTLSLADGSSVNVGSRSGLGSHATAVITGRLALPVGAATFNVAPHAPTPPLLFGPELDIPAAISGGSSAQLTVLDKYGLGRMRLSGNNSYLNRTRIFEGTLQVDGAQSSSVVQVNAGTLQGTGTVGPIFLTSASAAVAPGDSPGILSSGDFGGGGGALQVELNGTTPGAGYDQLNVIGAVNLAGVSLNASLGYASSVSDQFTIIANDGSDAVTGTFTGLPQGKKLYLGKELFQISYTGGSGNDVVLTRLVTPPPPVLTIQSIPPGAVRLLWATNDPDFGLETVTNLPGTNWTVAVPLPVVVGANNVVTNPAVAGQKFYRLFK